MYPLAGVDVLDHGGRQWISCSNQAVTVWHGSIDRNTKHQLTSKMRETKLRDRVIGAQTGKGA